MSITKDLKKIHKKIKALQKKSDIVTHLGEWKCPKKRFVTIYLNILQYLWINN